jgi:hypothetical protein
MSDPRYEIEHKRVHDLEDEVERLRERVQILETYIREKAAEDAGGWTLPADVQIEYGKTT